MRSFFLIVLIMSFSSIQASEYRGIDEGDVRVDEVVEDLFSDVEHKVTCSESCRWDFSCTGGHAGENANECICTGCPKSTN